MLDPRYELVLLWDKKRAEFVDRTSDIVRYSYGGHGRVDITFANSRVQYPYGPDRVRVFRDPELVQLDPGQRAEVDGDVWASVRTLYVFGEAQDAWMRVCYNSASGERSRTVRADQVRVISNSATQERQSLIIRYWQTVAASLRGDASLRTAYESMPFVHPDSALARYLSGAPIERRTRSGPLVFPFRSNLSQRQAVDHAMTQSVSVIEGPPGTGKTETILNLIANIITSGAATIGVVSLSNAAVDNVATKLTEVGYGHVLARLGNQAVKDDFFDGQRARSTIIDEFVRGAPVEPDTEHVADLSARLVRLQHLERELAEVRGQRHAFGLEAMHFAQHVAHEELPDLARLPLLRRSSDTILDYLVESHIEQSVRPSVARRIGNYFRYGSTRGLDPNETAVVLSLQQAYYDRRIAELTSRLERLQDDLDQANFEGLTGEFMRVSEQFVRARTSARYKDRDQAEYDVRNYKYGHTFRRFVDDYPVILSTCHSLRRTLPSDYLLDYLIIDEASQVDLLAAGIVLGCCRNLVVVGDLNQLPHISDNAARGVAAPFSYCDYQHHSILSSLKSLYGNHLPQTLLREHYRCDPAIIGFCNKAFYGGALVPFTSSRDSPSMIVWRTTEGNHMRDHTGGGRTNQREIDAIVHEVLPRDCAGVSPADIGITTPYRRQADRVTQEFIDDIASIEADTVHKFQGRQKPVMIMTTVLDETRRGHAGLTFVDDARLINVAVSRAESKFILVTNYDLLPRSRNIRDLIDYIRYQSATEAVDSEIVSIFDLLYSEYSRRLQPLAAKLLKPSRYPSENIALTVLNDIVAEVRYQHLAVSPQVLMRNLLPDLVRLTPREAAYVQNRASVDFVVYNRVSNRPVLAVEVDGFAFHENNPAQRERDALKNQIMMTYKMPLLRLPTTGSGEVDKIHVALDHAEMYWASVSRTDAQTPAERLITGE